MKRYPGDGGPTWIEALGGDGITTRTITWHAPGEGPGLSEQFAHLSPGSFRKELEDILAECDEILAKHDWLKVRENGKRDFPGDRDCQPYSDLWYAGKIGFECWLLLNYEELFEDEGALRRAMRIGSLLTEWEWRRRFRSFILRGDKTLKGAQAGAAGRRGAFAAGTQKRLDEMNRLIEKGRGVSEAAHIVARKLEGYTATANRALWYRHNPRNV